MATIKVAEAIGPVLDYLVAKASGLYAPEPWIANPSTNWSQGGPIIEREVIALRGHGDEWIAFLPERLFGVTGLTPLIAAMRCYVASKLGDSADVPDELI